jgi:hypothetical protein
MADSPDILSSPAVAAPPPPPSLDAAVLSGGVPAPVAPAPAAAAPVAAAPQAAGVPSVWKQIVVGALSGLAASAGQKHFGGGLAAGAGGAIEEKYKEKALEMESVRAADSHLAASRQAAAADVAASEHAQDLKDHALIYDQTLRALGIAPSLTLAADNPAEMHAQAVGGLNTLAQRNGGDGQKIPGVATTNIAAHVADDGKTHTINVYTTTPGDVTRNPNGNRQLVDEISKIKTGSPLPDATWTSGNGEMLGKVPAPLIGQASLVQEAKKFLLPQLPNQSAAMNAATSAENHQQLESYRQSLGDQPTETQANVLKLLTAKTAAFDSAMEDTRAKAAAAEIKTTAEQAPGAAAAAGLKTAAEEAAKIDPRTQAGRLNLQEKQQNILDKKFSNADKSQKALLEEGQNPITGEKLHLGNAPDEMLVDANTHQPIPIKMLSTLKPTQQESNRADFARSALHSLDLIDDLKAKGNLPNGPITGWTTKALIKSGLSGKDAADAYGLIALTQSAATGAHVGGRFSAQIMEKMSGLLTLNANDSQFEGQELAIRQVMGPYAAQGGRETVLQYKSNLMGQKKVINGREMQVAGFDKNGQIILSPTGK